MDLRIPEQILLLADADETEFDCVRTAAERLSVPLYECRDLYEAVRQLAALPESASVLMIGTDSRLCLEQNSFFDMLRIHDNWKCCCILQDRREDLLDLRDLFWNGRLFPLRDSEELHSILQWLPNLKKAPAQPPSANDSRRIHPYEYRLSRQEVQAILEVRP